MKNKVGVALIALLMALPLGVSAQTADDVLINLLASLEGPVQRQTQVQSKPVIIPTSTPITPSQPSLAQASSAPATTFSPFNLFAVDGNTPKPDPQVDSLKAALASLYAQFASIASKSTVAVVAATTTASTTADVTPSPPKKKFTRDLSIGSKGADVKELQVLLIAHGFLFGEPTSYFGILTKTAVLAFQTDNGLPAVGSVGPRTRAVLNEMELPTKDVVQQIIYGPPAKALVASSTSSSVIASSTVGTSTPIIGSTTPESILEIGKPVSVSMSILPSEAPVGGSVAVTWLSQNATSCEASDGWGGAKPTIGAAVIEPLQFSLNFVLTCTGPGGVASTSALVVVGGEQ
jgi:peptidoglycan hydrolase-like protein with peptidoglycan-binding domain